jgi:hypothetical protein
MVLRVKPEDIVTFEDGYRYYWPKGFPHGAFSASNLRDIANHLDELNAEWDKQVIEELSNKPDKFFYNKNKNKES